MYDVCLHFSELRFLFVSLFLSFVAAIEEPVTSTNSYLLESDKLRFKKILENGFKLEDLPSVYYAVQGYKLLNEATPKASVRMKNFIFSNFYIKQLFDVMKIAYVLNSHDSITISLSEETINFLNKLV